MIKQYVTRFYVLMNYLWFNVPMKVSQSAKISSKSIAGNVFNMCIKVNSKLVKKILRDTPSCYALDNLQPCTPL